MRLLLIVNILVCTVCSSQTEYDVNTLIDSIISYNQYEFEFIGRGNKSLQWERYEKLRDKLPVEELRKLINHKRAIISAYAFTGLIQRGDKEVFKILKTNLSNKRVLDIQIGCVPGDYSSIGEHFVELVKRYNYLDDGESKILDSLFLFDKSINMYLRDLYLKNIDPKKRYYKRIREIAIEEGNEYGIIALSKYNKTEDLDLIKSLFKEERNVVLGLYAVREFPDDSFYPVIESIYEKELSKDEFDYDEKKNRLLYQVLAKYNTEDTYKKFERLLKAKRRSRIQNTARDIYIAIEKYPSKRYNKIKEMIKLSKIELRTANELMEIDE